ncbi:MAG TPA: type II/IV secretion system ATPase subunit [Candidatus Nanoarchaeia archaeon]|nr:type II/IV secretion system ATPase subunit [Candidatus Nanoarchaeia archaeon]
MAGFDKKCFEYEVYKEADNKILKIYGESCSFPISLEESETCFSKIFNLLAEINGITTLILSQQREYEYDYHQVSMLIELVSLFKSISQDERFSPAQLVDNPFAERYLRGDFAFFQRLIQHRLSSDPLASYLELKRLLRHEKIKVKGIPEVRGIEVAEKFTALLEEVVTRLEATKFIGLSHHYLSLYQPGSREIYRRIFRPTTRPDFMFTKLMAEYPSKGEILDSYSVGRKEEQSDVTIFNFPDSVKNLYHLTPPEFKFTEEKYELLDSAKRIMSEHQPTKEEFTDPDKMREVFFNIGRDLITDLVRYRKLKMLPEEIDALAQALLRYTVGFGLIEILLSDEKVQDVNINSPSGEVPIFIVHQDFGDCYTNIYPTPAEVEGWATKLRLISGRPLDEANAILDTELKVPGFSSRVAAITRPLNPSGLAFSFRRHRDYPWTFPLYLNPKVKMFNATAAGLLSFLIDNNAAILIAGTRSSGKTSLLGSFLVEIMRRYRMITLEDTLELPTESLRRLGFNIQSLKVASALAAQGSEVDAATGIRSTLRLGDSAIIVGEVRSKEAISLYEAMRIGAAANVVAGTIHAASPYGVFDRVVNDIGVPRTSFKATDIIVVANPVKSASGIKRVKRVLSITEIRKEWEEDPLKEGAFGELMKYDPIKDELMVTDDLINGNSDILKSMAANIRDFAGNWDAVWENILLRGQCKQAIVDAYLKAGNKDILEAPFVIRCNDMFHLLSEKIKEEVGSMEPKRILFEYQDWLKKEIKKGSINPA